ncbi:hypothetical protein [Ralstonia psammae]|uniref:hypothetical protein n=1 Tax=Ralstonia psammae TaxID=3058598 RepID=UPI003D16679F
MLKKTASARQKVSRAGFRTSRAEFRAQRLKIKGPTPCGKKQQRQSKKPCQRLCGRMFDVLFVNTGTTNPGPTQSIGEVSTEDFVALMMTNALSPMRVAERLAQGAGQQAPIYACHTAYPSSRNPIANSTSISRAAS